MKIGQKLSVKVNTRGFEVHGHAIVVVDERFGHDKVRLHVFGSNDEVENGSIDYYIPALNQPAVLIEMLGVEIANDSGLAILV